LYPAGKPGPEIIRTGRPGGPHGDYGKLPPAILADRRLSSTDKLVAQALISFAWGDKAECWPSLPAIAARVGRSVQTARLSVRNLAHFGHVAITRGGYFGGSNRYSGGNRYTLLWRHGIPPAGPSPETPSPRSRESARVGRARKGVGAGVCNSVGAGVCNSTPEVFELEAHEERFERPCVEDAGAAGPGRPAAPEPDAPPESPPDGPRAPEPVDLAEAFGRLTRDATAAAVEQAARALGAELSGTDRGDFSKSYLGLARDVAGGKLTTAAVVVSLAESRKPGVRCPGAVFNAAVKRCRANGGKPPAAPAAAGPARARPTPAAHKAGTPWHLMSEATVKPAVRGAVRQRAGGGMADEDNRAKSRRQAESTCSAYGLTGADRARYLAWVDEAVEDELAPTRVFRPSRWPLPLGGIGRGLPRRAVL
jgi:hypothetical protein